jgi:hypothetical protein
LGKDLAPAYDFDSEYARIFTVHNVLSKERIFVEKVNF